MVWPERSARTLMCDHSDLFICYNCVQPCYMGSRPREDTVNEYEAEQRVKIMPY